MIADHIQDLTETLPPFRVEIEPSRLLSEQQELAVLRAAHERQPQSPRIRARLAGALLLDNDFDATIDLLSDSAELSTEEWLIRIQAHLSRERSVDDHSVVAIADRQLAHVVDLAMCAQFLADKAKASRRLGQHDAARAALDAALACDPANKDACKRIAALDLEAGRAEQAIATLERLAADGTSHARLYAAQTLAHARCGQIAVAREIVAFETLQHAGRIEVPPGFDSIAAFNAALAAELLAHPSLRFDRYGTASERTWRIDTPLLGDAPMLRLLLDRIARSIEAHVARIVAHHDHPWVRARPRVGILHCWCVMTDHDGFETWHVHQFGWLSGVYYVRVPVAVGPANDAAGCIAFGLPEALAGTEAAAGYGTTIVRPEEGMVMLFPSHVYHRTFPHGADERRICVAFDVWPG